MTLSGGTPFLHRALLVEAEEVSALRTAVAEALTAQFGQGHWSSCSTVKGVARAIEAGDVWVAREGGQIVATLALHKKKPWAIDPAYFTPVPRPLYLTNMAVLPELQRHGLGRGCLEDLVRVLREWPAQAVRLDAYDTSGEQEGAGAGGFYRKCGYQERGRVVYRTVPLVYFERVVATSG